MHVPRKVGNRLALSCFVIITLHLCAAAYALDSTNASAFNYKVIKSVDLTKPFHTRSNWRFVVTQEPEPHSELGEPGLIHFCFVRKGKPGCSEDTGPEFLAFNTLGRAEVVRPSGSGPLLMVTAMTYSGGPGSANPTTILWTYRSESDTFKRIFAQHSNRNNNEETRLMTRGPLAGDLVVSNAPTAAPYHYSISVYHLSESGKPVEILKYTGKTRYGDVDPRAVIDAEMPEIPRRLHLSKRASSP